MTLTFQSAAFFLEQTNGWRLNFAYKLSGRRFGHVYSQLLKWATRNRYDIEARAPQSNRTKDQLRLMVPSLLADRFGLVTHFEDPHMPVYDVVLSNPGKLVKHLRPYGKDPPFPVVGAG